MDAEIMMVGLIGVAVLTVAGLWGVFAKAGRPGWHALVPVLNMVTLCQVSGLSGWFAIATLIPLVNMIFMFYLAHKLAACFGKGLGFALGIVFLGFAFLPMLAFGSASYTAPEEASESA